KKGYALPEKQSEEDTHKSFSTSDLVIKDSLMEMIVDKQLKDNMVVHTLGYYEAGDGGGATYRLYPSMENKDAQLGEWKLETNLVARLIVVQVVSYAMFGARGNGIDDDGVYIKQAHDFANMHRL